MSGMDANARGIADPGTGNRLGAREDGDGAAADARSDAELRRADYRDAYRAGMIQRFTDESLAREHVFSLVIMARQASDGVSGDWGPRTMYAHAVNLLTLYAHLLDRARASVRDRDGALLTRAYYSEELLPWTPARIKRVEDLREFQPDMIARWNSIVALGEPPPYDARRPWNGVRPQKVKLIVDRRPKPGISGGAGVIEMPLGLYGVIRPGGVDARILYRLLKTAEMDPATPEGRKAILAAVIEQIIEPKRDEKYYDDAAAEMLKRDGASSRGVVYANDPQGFRKLQHTDEFNFEVGMTFLMYLDEVTGGSVPWRVLQLLEPGIDVRQHEPRPLWQELYPNNSFRERAQWIWKRVENARVNWDPASGRLRPGRFYKGHDMFFVAEGAFVGDQIWATRDGRIFTVNEREAMIEAFRQGVLAAAGMVALAYIQVALALILVEGPAMLANIGRLITAPVEASKELLMFIRANPFKVMGTVALDQATSFMLAEDKEEFLEDFGSADTWLNVFLSLLMIKDLRQIHLPSGGGKFIVVDKELRFIPAAVHAGEGVAPGALEGPLVPGGESGTLTPDSPPVSETPPVTETAVAPPAVTKAAPGPRAAKADTVVDDGAAVVIHSDKPTPESAGDLPRKPPDSAADAPRAPPETAGDPPPNAGRAADRANAQEQQGIADAQVENSRAVGDESGAQMSQQRGTHDRFGGGQRKEAEEIPRKMTVADEGGGAKKPGGGSKKRAVPQKGKTQKGGTQKSGTQKGAPKKGAAVGKREAAPEGDAKSDSRTRDPDDKGGARAKKPPPDLRGVKGSRANGEERFTFTRDGIEYQVHVSSDSMRAYDDIPIGDTVVYSVHNQQGDVIYVGISKKGEQRAAVDRLQEHLTTKDGVFIAEAAEFRVRGHYGDEYAAHALEQHLISTSPGTKRYNKDQIPWTTFINYRESLAQRYPRQSRGLDDDLRIGTDSPSRKPRPDYHGYLQPELDKPIRFDIEFNHEGARIRGPDPDAGPGVHPDFDPEFDPKLDL